MRYVFLAVLTLSIAAAQPELAYDPIENWGEFPPDLVKGAAMAVAVDADDNVWLYSRSSHPVMQFTPQGRLLRAWKEDQQLSNHQGAAHGMAIGPDGGV